MSNSIENEMVNKLFKDRKADRRWRNIRFFGWLAILIVYAILIFSSGSSSSTAHGPYVSLVRLSGAIMPGAPFSAKRVIPALNKAFMDKHTHGVVLQINSPGGSPVQASIIHDKILELKKQYHKKVIVVGEDALASGAYLVATAADKIYVNRDTLTGSIGVIMSGFGFSDAISKLGISRRVFTAGKNKDRLDPFEKLDTADIDKVKKVLDQVHQNFINDVVAGRGDLLKGSKEELFSGDFWTGEQAVKLGLADNTMNLWTAIKTEFNVKHIRDYSPKESFFHSLFKQASTELKFHLMANTEPLQARAY